MAGATRYVRRHHIRLDPDRMRGPIFAEILCGPYGMALDRRSAEHLLNELQRMLGVDTQPIYGVAHPCVGPGWTEEQEADYQRTLQEYRDAKAVYVRALPEALRSAGLAARERYDLVRKEAMVSEPARPTTDEPAEDATAWFQRIMGLE